MQGRHVHVEAVRFDGRRGGVPTAEHGNLVPHGVHVDRTHVGRVAQHLFEKMFLTAGSEVDHRARDGQGSVGETRRRPKKEPARRRGQDARVRAAVVADPDGGGPARGVEAGTLLGFQEHRPMGAREVRRSRRTSNTGADHHDVGGMNIHHAPHDPPAF